MNAMSSINTPQNGLLLVISGPSGSGKSTVARNLCDEHPHTVLSRSATTRTPREGEGPSHYDFVSREEFLRRVSIGKMLEYVQYNGEYYGTSADEVENLISRGHNAILEIDTHGGLQVRKRYPDSVLVFLSPPSFSELAFRLRGRGTESEEQIAKRLAIAESELNTAQEYDYFVVNHYIDESVRVLRAIIEAEGHRVRALNQTIVWLKEDVARSKDSV